MKNYLVMSSILISGKVRTFVSEKMDRVTAKQTAKLFRKQSRYISINIIPIW